MCAELYTDMLLYNAYVRTITLISCCSTFGYIVFVSCVRFAHVFDRALALEHSLFLRIVFNYNEQREQCQQ